MSELTMWQIAAECSRLPATWARLAPHLAARRAICGIRGHRPQRHPLVLQYLASGGKRWLKPCNGCSKMVEVPQSKAKPTVIWMDEEISKWAPTLPPSTS